MPFEDFLHCRITGIYQFTSPIYLIRDPKLVKRICVKDFDHFTDHRPFIDEKCDKLLGKALSVLRGQKWRGKYKETVIFAVLIWLISRYEIDTQPNVHGIENADDVQLCGRYWETDNKNDERSDQKWK